MGQFLVVASGLLGLFSVAPYLRDMFRGATRPNLTSWFTWTLLYGIATAAEFDAGAGRTALFTGAIAVSTLLVIVLGLRLGRASVSAFDLACQVAALGGILLWQLLDSPTAGVLAVTAVDLIGALPTVRHAWRSPREETAATYAIAAVAAVCALAALRAYTVVSMTYEVYVVALNAGVAAIIVTRRQSSQDASGAGTAGGIAGESAPADRSAAEAGRRTLPVAEGVDEELAHAGDPFAEVFDGPVRNRDGRQHGDIERSAAHDL